MRLAVVIGWKVTKPNPYVDFNSGKSQAFAEVPPKVTKFALAIGWINTVGGDLGDLPVMDGQRLADCAVREGTTGFLRNALSIQL